MILSKASHFPDDPPKRTPRYNPPRVDVDAMMAMAARPVIRSDPDDEMSKEELRAIAKTMLVSTSELKHLTKKLKTYEQSQEAKRKKAEEENAKEVNYLSSFKFIDIKEDEAI